MVSQTWLGVRHHTRESDGSKFAVFIGIVVMKREVFSTDSPRSCRSRSRAVGMPEHQ